MRLPEPKLSARHPFTAAGSRIDLGLPSTPAGSRLTGLIGAENKYSGEAWELLRYAPDDPVAGAAAPAAAPAACREPLDPRLRAKRESAYLQANADINSLTLERRQVVEQLGGKPSKAAASGGGGASGGAVDHADRAVREAEAREERERHAEDNKARKALAMAKSASGRINARLEILRDDMHARRELEMRVEGWKGTRSNGQMEARDFIKENRAVTRTISMGSLMESRKRAAYVWEERKTAAQGRLALIEGERDVRRRALEQQFISEQLQREQGLYSGSPRGNARPATAAAVISGGGHLTPGGTSLPVALKNLPPRERAQILRLEMERRRRWMLLLVLAKGAGHMLDELVYARNNRHLELERGLAAQTIQRKYTAKAMRKNLHMLHKSMGCLRKNTGIFAFKWRVRNKVRPPHLASLCGTRHALLILPPVVPCPPHPTARGAMPSSRYRPCCHVSGAFGRRHLRLPPRGQAEGELHQTDAPLSIPGHPGAAGVAASRLPHPRPVGYLLDAIRYTPQDQALRRTLLN